VFFNQQSDLKEFLLDYKHEFKFRIPKVCSGEENEFQIPVRSAFMALHASKALFYNDYVAYYAIIDEQDPQKVYGITINTKSHQYNE
jgi:hypothetical protein